jgi:hypothetical protein
MKQFFLVPARQANASRSRRYLFSPINGKRSRLCDFKKAWCGLMHQYFENASIDGNVN